MESPATGDVQKDVRTPPAWFLEAAREVGVEFEPGDVEKLGAFLALMLEMNKTTNLTAITEPEDAWRKHILDAMTLVGVVASAGGNGGSDEATEGRSEEGEGGEKAGLSVIDVGSGGGVPAIPLAIVMPDVRVTMVEATGRKAEFLLQAIRTLGLKNARVLNERAEVVGQDHREHREKYDVAMARALGHLAIVVELCGPLVRQGGIVIGVKGAKAPQEIEEAKDAMGKVGVRYVQTVDTPTGKLVVMEKTIKTPRLYPRKDGEPSRVPLGVKRK